MPAPACFPAANARCVPVSSWLSSLSASSWPCSTLALAVRQRPGAGHQQQHADGHVDSEDRPPARVEQVGADQQAAGQLAAAGEGAGALPPAEPPCRSPHTWRPISLLTCCHGSPLTRALCLGAQHLRLAPSEPNCSGHKRPQLSLKSLASSPRSGASIIVDRYTPYHTGSGPR